LHSIQELSNAQAGLGLAVDFEATVTFFRRSERTLFVQDGDDAIYVNAETDAALVPGDRIRIEGTTQSSFRPIVVTRNIKAIGHGALPKPIPITFDELIRGKYDCKLVTVRAVIRTVDMQKREDVRNSRLPMHTVGRVEMQTEGGYIETFIDGEEAAALSSRLDAEVSVTGVAGLLFDGKMQGIGAQLNVSKLADVKVLAAAQVDPWTLPVTPMDQIITTYHVRDLSQRLRIHGAITYYQPGTAMVIQDGSKSLWLATRTRGPWQIGDVADAIGFPSAQNGLLELTHAEVRDTQVRAPVQPLALTWRQLTGSGHPSDLVSIEGEVVTAVREASQDEFVLFADNQLFTAIYHHPETGLQPMKQVAAGTRVRVTGICVLEDSKPFNAQVPFDILLRSFDDVVEVAQPPWWNMQRLMLAVGLLVLVAFAAGLRSWTLERKLRLHSSALARRIEAEAALERRRSRILEDINGVRPLAEILEEITGLVSFKLGGAPCWCEVSGGARLGNPPSDLGGLRIAREEIPGRTGPALGRIFAGLDPLSVGGPNEAEALSTGAGLAALAIETRRLYTDLIHRSEYDLLTDIHNRFSVDRQLDAMILEARKTAGIFGLIYIDLDEFKQVNDVCGHQVGDLYLQQVAIRMKRQLRPADVLARLGGDEFAVLVPQVRNRAEVEEIALRLERCFDDPFAADAYLLHGSASVGIALYPENAATKDGLLSFADAAMYAAKHHRKPHQKARSITGKPGSTPQNDGFSI
jgi:diguanylate cyclase (GGDEF)-like protein